MKYFSLIIIFLVIIIFGCNRKPICNQNNIEVINLSKGIESNGIPKNISNIASDIQYIFLERSDECLIDKVDKLLLDENLIFIFNKKQFFIFDDSGKFVRSIGRIGKGPGEYLRIMDFTINRANKTIYIYDSDLMKVMIYKYNGQLISEFKLNSYPTCITSIDDKLIALLWVKPDYLRNENFGLSYYTLDGQLIGKRFNREFENADESFPSTFLTGLNYYCDSLTYWEINLDTIYRINNNMDMIPRYKIDYYSNKERKNMSKVSKNIFRYSKFLETDKYLFFLGGVYNNKLKHIIVNKKTKECYNLLFKNTNDMNLQIKSGFTNDFDGGYPFLPFDILRDGRMYCTFYPYELKGIIKQNLYNGINILNKEKQQELYLKINNSLIMDNPIIMLVSLK